MRSQTAQAEGFVENREDRIRGRGAACKRVHAATALSAQTGWVAGGQLEVGGKGEGGRGEMGEVQ
jgi:hypothetical protein